MSIYPTTSSGTITQRPYTQDVQFLHVNKEMECGPRFSYSYRTTPLNCFTITHTAINDVDLATLEAFFVSMQGRFGTFSFTDVNGNVFSTCRFDQDDFTVKNIGPNQSQVTLKVCEVGYL